MQRHTAFCVVRLGRMFQRYAVKKAINEECPGTFRHPGYYEKIYLMCLLINVNLV